MRDCGDDLCHLQCGDGCGYDDHKAPRSEDYEPMNTLYLEKTGIHATLTTRSEADLLDSEAKTAALKYRTKKEWRITDPSTYARAARWRRWRKDDWRECTGHMILVKARHPGTNYCPLRYTDDRILSSARNFYTRTQWEKATVLVITPLGEDF
jgi:hypothetical protein